MNSFEVDSNPSLCERQTEDGISIAICKKNKKLRMINHIGNAREYGCHSITTITNKKSQIEKMTDHLTF